MAYNVKWYGPLVSKKIEEDVKKRLMASAIVVANHAKTLISEPYPPPSEPGSPPHRRTGRLRASISWDVVGRAVRIGSNVVYAKFLELGTSRIRPRPWLRRALIEKTNEILRIMKG